MGDGGENIHEARVGSYVVWSEDVLAGGAPETAVSDEDVSVDLCAIVECDLERTVFGVLDVHEGLVGVEVLLWCLLEHKLEPLRWVNDGDLRDVGGVGKLGVVQDDFASVRTLAL